METVDSRLSRCLLVTVLALFGVVRVASAQPPPEPQPIYSGTERALVPPAPSSYITARMAPAVIDRAGLFVQHAACAEGEQLLGGGYFSGASFPHPNVVSVHGSYPSSESTWTAVFHSALAPEAKSPREGLPPFRDVVINVFAYCFGAPGYPLGLTTQTADNATLAVPVPTIKSDGVSGVEQSWNVACPAGSVLTGGGFKVEPPVFEDDANANVDLTASKPVVSGGIATGWMLHYVARTKDAVRRVTAYARCAGRGLTALPAAELAEHVVTEPAFSEHDFLARCPSGGIATAGGYQHEAGHWLPPRPVFVSRSAPDLLAWQVKAMGGFQHVEAVNDPTPLCDPKVRTCLRGAAFASCYAPPAIDYISVHIVSPPDRYQFGIAAHGAATTTPIVFTAKVYDRDGALLPGAEVVWSHSTRTGWKVMGKGQRLVAQLPAAQTLETLRVRAVARTRAKAGKPRLILTATDTIQLTTGTVQ